MLFMYSYYYNNIQDWLCKNYIHYYTDNYSPNFAEHMEHMYLSLELLKHFKFKKCKLCLKDKNIKVDVFCNNCKKFNLIKYSNNSITKKLPIEIILYIQTFI
jgi:hypothetical protein